MAEVEKLVPVPMPEVRISLTRKEADALYTLLYDGVDAGTVREMGLTDLQTKLSVGGGCKRDTNISFDYMAEI